MLQQVKETGMRSLLLFSIVLFTLIHPAASFAKVELQRTSQCAKGRIELAEKPEVCPCCGASPVAWIMYGLPNFTDKLQKAIDDRVLVLGGCVVTDDDPRWACTYCGTLFFEAGKATRGSCGGDPQSDE